MTKKIVSILLIVCMALAFLTACGGTTTTPPANTPPADSGTSTPAPDAGKDPAPAPADEKQFVFKYAFGQPLESTDGKGYQYLAKVLEEESGGSVKMELYPASSLISNNEVLDALMDGTADMSHATVAYLSPTIKELTPLEIPGMYRGDRYFDFAAALHQPIDEICNAYGVKIVAVLPACVMNLASTDGIMKSPADMAGKNIRCAGKWMGEGIGKWGGNGVTITLADVPTALERKTVDAVYGGCNTVIFPFKLYELADYVSFTSLQENLGFIAMNLDTWNEMSANQQAAMNRAIAKWAVYTEQLQLDDVKAFEAALEANGNTVYYLTDEENQVLIDKSLELLPQAIEVAGEKGQQLADICAEIRAGYDVEYQPGVIPEGYNFAD
ncbi:MAG: TRAP transporter substrate-binding protein [Oscillospiraceae bacterium]|nr:TRAP transporter substrate-binding protein [Oscillospiraceae bacterium]